MQPNALDERLRNLTLILILIVVTVFTAYNEGYLSGEYTGNNVLLYWASILGAGLFGIWLSMGVSTRRLAALMFVTFVIEYIKETVGVTTGLWMYKGNPGGYLLGVWTWVWGGVTIYCIASRISVRFTSQNPVRVPRFLNPILIVAIFSVLALFCPELPFCNEKALKWWSEYYVEDTWIKLFWGFYVVLMFIGIIASLFTTMRTLIGIVITVLIIGYIGEIAGASANIWQYWEWSGGACKYTPVPQLYLLVGCLPLEVIAQFALAALLAGEALVVVPPMPPKQGEPETGPEDDGPKGGSNYNDADENEESDKDTTKQHDGSNAEQRGRQTEKNNTKAAGPDEQESKIPPDPMQFGLDDEGKVIGDDVPLTLGEMRLAAWLRISAIMYFIVGLAFFLFPNEVMFILNKINNLPPGEGHWFSLVPCPEEGHQGFWLSMTVSMMMCVTFLAFYAQYNIRKNKLYTVPLLIAKFTSSFAALMIFMLQVKYFCVFAVFVVDGFLFWFTLNFYVRANRDFLEQQTAYFRKKIQHARSSGPATVVALKGEDKFALLDQVLERADFYRILDERFEKIRSEKGISKEEFSVVIKPNFMFMHAREDYSTYTDPELVEALIDRIWERGYRKVSVVEAQSTLGNYYDNRDVVNVAKVIGYSTDHEKYRVVDLTKEMVRHYYGGRLGWHWIGPTWRDAHFRISFAKNKTHTFCGYTLTLKNIYGAFPVQNKFKQYHVKWEYDWPTIESLRERNCPVHFGLVDAFYSADGQFGVMTDQNPNHTKTIIGGDNLIAVDNVGARKMGLDPENINVGRFYYLAVREFGKPEITWIGDKSVYQPWENVSQLIIQTLDLFEETYHFGNWWFSALSANGPQFPLKPQSATVNFLRWVFKPIKATQYWPGVDVL